MKFRQRKKLIKKFEFDYSVYMIPMIPKKMRKPYLTFFNKHFLEDFPYRDFSYKEFKDRWTGNEKTNLSLRNLMNMCKNQYHKNINLPK